MRELLTIEVIEKLDIREIWNLYRDYINPAQVNILSAFPFGHDQFTHAEGMYLYTSKGRRILDFTGGIGVLNHGHNHPRILKARIAYQQEKRMEIHKTIFSPYLAGLSHNVAQLLPGDLNKCFFANSGAEAVEGALKVAYKSQSKIRDYILHADISFHGKLIASGSISGQMKEVFQFPRMAHTASFEYGNLSSVRGQVNSLRRPDGSSNVYAIIVEPYNASNLMASSAEFLTGLRELCDREAIVLIFDEVYTGWGKCGSLFYFMRHKELLPDILAMSKSLGGGKASISCYVVRDPIFMRAYGNEKDAFLHTSTYNGFGEECVTALEAIQIAVEDDYPKRARKIEGLLDRGLKQIKEKYPKYVKEVRGVGALHGVVFYSPFDRIERLLQSFPLKTIHNKSSFIDKITTASVIADLYERHGIFAGIIENKRFVALGATPSLIADEEHLEFFIESLDATLQRGLIPLAVGFLTRQIKNIL